MVMKVIKSTNVLMVHVGIKVTVLSLLSVIIVLLEMNVWREWKLFLTWSPPPQTGTHIMAVTLSCILKFGLNRGTGVNCTCIEQSVIGNIINMYQLFVQPFLFLWIIGIDIKWLLFYVKITENKVVIDLSHLYLIYWSIKMWTCSFTILLLHTGILYGVHFLCILATALHMSMIKDQCTQCTEIFRGGHFICWEVW
jgi:hypothetical protein